MECRKRSTDLLVEVDDAAVESVDAVVEVAQVVLVLPQRALELAVALEQVVGLLPLDARLAEHASRTLHASPRLPGAPLTLLDALQRA